MSSYSASKAHAEHGGATTVRMPAPSGLTQTVTYPHAGHTYGSPSHADFRVKKSYEASPPPADAGRIVLNNHRGPAGLDATPSLRVPPSASRARSPSYSNGFSTSFGAAGEALSLSASERARMPAPMQSFAHTKPAHADEYDARQGQTDVPAPGAPRFSSTAPTHSMGSMEAAARQYGMGAPTHKRESGSPSPRPHGDDSELSGSHGSNQLLHKCESCSKVYRHPSCLVKHRWVCVYMANRQEHTMYWKEASKFLMSKHQQVQLLEAAAILVGMDSNARSLPEEKALWPAAVSPPSSGLLGCDQVNFDKLMASKARNASVPLSDAPSVPFGTSAPAHPSLMADTMRAAHQRDAGKPMHTRTRADDDLDEDDDMGARDDSSELDFHAREDGYGLHSGGDVMADMDMDADE